MVEVPISRMKRKIVLERKCRDPDVVGWDRRTLLLQLSNDSRVLMRGLIIREKCSDATLREEAAKCPFVVGSTIAERESSTKFGDRNEWKEYFVGVFNDPNGFFSFKE